MSEQNVWLKAFLSVCKPKPRLSGSQWADKHRYIAPGTSPEPGEWRTDRTPYLKEPMDVATDSETEFMVLCCSSQVGKSEALLNIMGFYMAEQPSPILMLQPTLGMAAAFSKERIDPTMRWSPALNELLPQAKEDGRGTSRKTGATIFMKNFPGGYLALVGANSPAGLASRPIRILLADEVDRYTDTKEGAPLALAIQRTTNFHNRKVCMVSTPTIKGASEIEKWYLKSDQRKFFIPCPHCGEAEPWRWEMVKWDKTEVGELIPDSIRMECTFCHQKIRGPGRPDPMIIAKGEWRATGDTKSNVKGYHLNSLISSWVSLDGLVEEFRTAIHRKDRKGLQEFINLKLGEAFEVEDFREDLASKIMRRREVYGATIPDGVYLITAGCDVQHDRLEVTLVGWGRDKECWVLSHHILEGNPQWPDVWNDLDQLLQQTFPHPVAGDLPIACTCIDSGDGTMTSKVNAFTKAREMRRVFSIKGRGGMAVPFISRPTRGNRYNAMLFTVGVDSGKQLVLSSVQNNEKGPGYIHFPMDNHRGCDFEYAQQVDSERLETEFKDGRTSIKFVKKRERNEALDCLCYAFAAFEILGVDINSFVDSCERNGGGVNVMQQRRGRRTFSKGI